ncbi:toxin YoeB [Cyclobacterium lianum]|uniref:Putative mRNA interferase YoeB n=1 Tax=Cyclobacterium lianum TaxID=388280 RepID=A0A1M7M4B6_9BACT|nr:Txe/YoeB family addiction module toxin [Cyclobacterium lianum]SHM85426.1 toxin YoeB [Cyclobacterium lianum]
MNIEFTPHGWEDYQYWVMSDPDITKKINSLIKGIIRDPFKGEGKPEALKGNYRGYWSRRINKEHRLVYAVLGTKGRDQKCTIIQCRFHY